MAVLLLAEHDNGSLAPATGKAVTAARAFGCRWGRRIRAATAGSHPGSVSTWIVIRSPPPSESSTT